jgi:hypothetical protein
MAFIWEKTWLFVNNFNGKSLLVPQLVKGIVGPQG